MTVADKKPAKKKDPKAKAFKRRTAEAEARTAEVELRKAELSLELEELLAHDTRHRYALKANGDGAHGVFSLERSVGTSVPDLAAEIRHYARTYPDAPITLNIFSPGGSVFHGLVLYDTLRTLSKQGHAVTTVARGMAASMGSLIFLAGDNRLIGSQALVMFHGMSAGTGGDIYTMKEDIEFYERLEKRMDEIVFERTKVTPKLLARKTKKKDWWLHADECLKLKVATALG